MTINYSACIKKIYPTAILGEDIILTDDGTGVVITYWNSSKLGTQPSLDTIEAQNLTVTKSEAILEIKEIRKKGLDLVALSAGVLAIYNENYFAAQNVLNSTGDVLTKSGQTCTQYLTGLGVRLGMNAMQFATYIIGENHRVNPTAYSIEERYLALAYGGDAANGIYPISVLTSENSILQAVENFRQFCGVTN